MLKSRCDADVGVVAGDMVGDTRRGGSVNFEQYTLIPHCNGTHTECVGHITKERISIIDCLKDVFIPAVLVSVEAQNIDGHESLLTKVGLLNAMEVITYVWATDRRATDTALIVRTLPNDESKKNLLLEKQPSAEFVTQEQIGALAVYFCSDAAAQVRGVAWNIDGGWTAQ